MCVGALRVLLFQSRRINYLKSHFQSQSFIQSEADTRSVGYLEKGIDYGLQIGSHQVRRQSSSVNLHDEEATSAPSARNEARS